MNRLNTNTRRVCWILLCLLSSCAARDQVLGLTAQVFDKPDDFDLSFTGNESSPSGLLQKAVGQELEVFVERQFPATAIDDAAYSLEVHYNQLGFPFAQVEYSLTKSDQGRFQVQFRIQEGPRTLLRASRFPGAEAFNDKILESHIQGPSRGAFGLGKLYYVAREAESAASSMESLYYQAGYIDVRVATPIARFSEDRLSVELTYSITEGARHSIQSLELTEAFKPAKFGLIEVLRPYLKLAYFPRITHQIKAACSAQLADLGYPDAQCQVKETIDSQTGHVKLVLSPEPGPLVRVGKIYISGNEATRTHFIKSQVELESGQVYSRGAELASFRNLYSSGLFSIVNLDLRGKGTSRDLFIEVEEAQTLSTSIEVGYGAFERTRLLLSATESNLAGTGRSLTFQGKLAEKARGAEVFFTDPYTIDREHVIGMSVFIEQRKLVSFESAEYGAGLSLTQHLSPNFRHIYGYEYRRSEAREVEVIGSGLSQALLVDANVSAIYLTNVLDTRDSFFLPKEGSWLRLRTEYASDVLASELSFLRFDGRAAHYLPLSDSSQLAIGLRAGLILPMQGTQAIPLQERFFNGGQNTVRSFREDELGPVDDNGKPKGGEAYQVISVEYRHDLIGNFSGALFADGGNVTLRHQDALRFEDMRYAVGLGLRWLLPIGPLRLDWGWNPDRRGAEEPWVLQFSLGVAF